MKIVNSSSPKLGAYSAGCGYFRFGYHAAVLKTLPVILLFALSCARPVQETPKAQPKTSVTSETSVSGSIDPMEVDRLPPILRKRFRTKTGKAAFDRAQSDRDRLVNEARRRGLHKEEEIAKQVRQLEERLIVQALLKTEAKLDEPTDADLRLLFDAERSRFSKEETRRVSRFLARVKGGDKAAAKKRAVRFRSALVQGKKRADVATTTDGAERVRGGDMGWLKRSERSPEFRSAAFALKLGGVSPVIEDPSGFYVLVVTDVKQARTPSFESVREEVRNLAMSRAQRKTYERVVAHLREATQ